MQSQSQSSGGMTQSQGQPSGNFTFSGYDTENFFDEMFDGDKTVRASYVPFRQRVEQLSKEDLIGRQHAAERALMSMGITFNVYSEGEGTERIMPIDIIPRVIEAAEWNRLEAGLVQRIKALNMFLDDVYNEQNILNDGVVPRDLIETSKSFLPACMGVKPPKGIWCHITGTDLIRGADGQMMVLEDNLRCPSGVSYMLENRELTKQTFPEVLAQTGVRPVSDYPRGCCRCFSSLLIGLTQRWWCLRRVSTTRRILSIRIWRSRWVWNWLKRGIWWCRVAT